MSLVCATCDRSMKRFLITDGDKDEVYGVFYICPECINKVIKWRQ